jgi:hypothetical protein
VTHCITQNCYYAKTWTSLSNFGRFRRQAFVNTVMNIVVTCSPDEFMSPACVCPGVDAGDLLPVVAICAYQQRRRTPRGPILAYCTVRLAAYICFNPMKPRGKTVRTACSLPTHTVFMASVRFSLKQRLFA